MYKRQAAGNIDIAFGLQYREEAFDLKRDKGSIVEFDSQGNLVKPADLLFLGGGSESSASRDAIALFAEVSVPVTDKLQVNGAVRYEELEEDSTFDPKISLRYEVSDSLILRASASNLEKHPYHNFIQVVLVYKEFRTSIQMELQKVAQPLFV